jgi:methyl-accepting chemotaxis protein
LICTRGEDVKKHSSVDVEILHKLSFMSGFSVWMEEIVNRFFFSSVLSLVYFGAAFLILIIGLNRFTDFIRLEFIIASVAFESSMLLIMFLTMAFSPNDDSYYDDAENNSENSDDLLIEIGEIGRDLAAAVVQIENLSKIFGRVAESQENLISQMKTISDQNQNLIKPNKGMLDEMKEVNISLANFNDKIKDLSESIDNVKNEKVKEAVREELQKIISGNLGK